MVHMWLHAFGKIKRTVHLNQQTLTYANLKYQAGCGGISRGNADFDKWINSQARELITKSEHYKEFIYYFLHF